MMTTVSSTWAKNNFGALIDMVIGENKRVAIKRGSRPVVVMKPAVDDFELNLSEKEIEGIEKGVKEFRKSFNLRVK